MSSTFFVTGGTGFIGRRLARRLIESGARVRLLARSGSLSKLSWLQRGEAEIIEGDLYDEGALRRGALGADGVFHLAGLTRESRTGEFMEVNCIRTQEFARICASLTTPPTFVYVSSLSCAGIAPKGDRLSGESGERLYDLRRRKREIDIPKPVSAYGRSKLAAERNLQTLASRLPISVVRPPYVFGEWDMASRQLYVMAKRRGNFVVPGWRDYYFSFVYVDDLVDVLCAAMTRGKRLDSDSLAPTKGLGGELFCSGQGIYFATSPEPILFSEYGRMLGRAFGRRRVRVFRVPPMGVLGAGVYGEFVKALSGRVAPMDWNKSLEALRGPWICSGSKAADELGVTISSELENKFRRVALWFENQGLL